MSSATGKGSDRQWSPPLSTRGSRPRNRSATRPSTTCTAETQFERYAAADEDGDGEVTLAELGAVPTDDGEPFGTLAARLYLGLVPQVLALQGASCSARSFETE